MATLTNVREALDVLLRYGDGYARAAHDTLFAGDGALHPERMSPGDRGRLAALGWHWDDLHECWVRYT